MRENYSTLSFADLEPVARDATLGAEGFKARDTRVSISVHSVRKRIADADGVSAKAVIDALVANGVLQDDSPAFVESVTHTQSKASKGESEYTVIIIENFDI